MSRIESNNLQTSTYIIQSKVYIQIIRYNSQKANAQFFNTLTLNDSQIDNLAGGPRATTRARTHTHTCHTHTVKLTRLSIFWNTLPFTYHFLHTSKIFLKQSIFQHIHYQYSTKLATFYMCACACDYDSVHVAVVC